MKNQYYKKDKKCIPFRKSSFGGGVFDPVSYEPIATPASVWCYTSQLSQDQIYEAKSYGESETRLFVLNYRTGIKVGDYILYRDEYYTVTRVDTKDDYNTELFVYVKDTPQGERPTGYLNFT